MKRFTPILGGALLAACSLAIDTSDLAGGPRPGPDGGPPVVGGPEGGPGIDGGKLGLDGAPSVACTIPTDADPKNCGACGRDCLGGACTKGTCGVAVIGRDFDSPLGVGVAGNKVYVGHVGGLVECDLDGGNPRTVVMDLRVHYVHATATDVFFSEHTTNAVRRWPRTGGPAVVVTSANNLEGVALTPTHLYYSRYTTPAQGGGVYRVTYPTVGAAELVLGYDHPEEVDWLGGKLFIGSDGPTNNVISVNDDGKGAQLTLVEGGGPVGVGVFGNDAFVARQSGAEVLRVPITGGPIEILARDQDRASGIVSNGNAVYWVEVGSGELDVLVR